MPPSTLFDFTHMILGFMIGSVSHIRKALIGDSAPLRALHGSASLLGNPTTPCIDLDSRSKPSKRSEEIRSRPACDCRGDPGSIFVQPLLVIGVVKAVCSLGMVGAVEGG
ncbi:hypothetical protein F3Y22_tig00002840pilonHSYRG00670 [Hibiscus syriacus]|uniref:Uncharacterized protein n=1 Tax=Hibiscus syriacus TaxID=106335 RepID=A0A6A3CVJ4_HIBSY|nr:hypothetical protein F3Y22_tig00002840pilonHSYRG00670 [Hibiscus syriacus]